MLRPVTAPVLREPLVPLAERPGPVTVQELALSADHSTVAERPERTRVGLADMESVGWSTVTVIAAVLPLLQSTV